MKICKKCNNEYKDDYIYCPKCGKPYSDSQKRVRVPEEYGSDAKRILWKIWNIFLYIFGAIMILGSLVTIVDEPITSILGILFGFSLFRIFYKLINDRTEFDESNLKIARVVIPIVLLVLIGFISPSEIETEEDISHTNIVENDGSANMTNDGKINMSNIKSEIEKLGIDVEEKNAYYEMVGASDGVKIYSGDYRIEIYKFDKSSEKYIEAEKNQKLKTTISSFDATVKNGYAYLIDDQFPKHDEVIKLLEELQ